MRESIGSTWTLQLIMGFTFLFVSFLAITISFSKAFKVRNEVTSIIEKNGGFTMNARETIKMYVESSGYRTTGRCTFEDGKVTFGIDLNGNCTAITGTTSNKYLFCIKKDFVNNNLLTNALYEVTMFYKFGLPIVGNITTFTVKGKTSDMIKINDLFEEGSC